MISYDMPQKLLSQWWGSGFEKDLTQTCWLEFFLQNVGEVLTFVLVGDSSS